jgi:hypothetical protein
MSIFLMKLKTIIRACIAAAGAAFRNHWRNAPRHTTRKHTSSDDDSPARGMYDSTSRYSTLPGGINDASRYNHKWD